MKAKNTKGRKGVRYPYEISLCAWIDLLGYGSMIKSSNFDPSDVNAKMAVNRLREFQEIIIKSSNRLFNVLISNDGAAFYRDLSPRTSSVTCDFLQRAIDVFYKVNEHEKKNGYYGARMVITTGSRARMDPQTLIGHKTLDNILKNYKNGSLSTEEAIRIAYISKPLGSIVPELQANFAFSKAYIIDGLGSRCGFNGNNCFIDTTIFKKNVNNWISFSKYVDYNDGPVSVKLGCLKHFDKDKLIQSDLLNAFEIAKKLNLNFQY